MSVGRSGYSDDWDGRGVAPELYRRAVENAINGKRGQAFLTELVAALDALPAKRLIEGDLERDGEVCAIGAVGRARGLDMKPLHVDSPSHLAEAFKIPRCLVAEIEFENDDDFSYTKSLTPEERFDHIRRWAVAQLCPVPQEKKP